MNLKADCSDNQKNQQTNLCDELAASGWLAAPHLKRKCHCNFQPHAVETIVGVAFLTSKETWFVRYYMLAGQGTRLHVDTA